MAGSQSSTSIISFRNAVPKSAVFLELLTSRVATNELTGCIANYWLSADSHSLCHILPVVIAERGSHMFWGNATTPILSWSACSVPLCYKATKRLWKIAGQR